jgi:hypothetical protein
VSVDDPTLGLTDSEAPPPPSPSLQAAVSGLAPVTLRVPGRAAVKVTLASLGWAALAFAWAPLRRDLPWLPRVWLVVVAALWATAFALPLGAALLPRRGQVLPDLGRASRVAVAVLGVMLLTTLLWTRDAPGHSLVPDGARALAASAGHCLLFGLKVCAGVLAAALLALRRVVRVGGWRAGAAVGAAAGGLAGLVLHLICPFASTAHVALGHAAGVALCGLLGALVAARVLR